MQEVQLTKGSYGHMLYASRVFSPDDNWVVYDIRNDQTHIARTCCLEKVNIHTGEVVKLYSAPNQTQDGPGVGAPTWHPTKNQIIFIHGLMNCDQEKPYGFTRRFGALLDEDKGATIIAADARSIEPPFVAGALRGGTHAHSWSGDGEWISFTYNDFILEKLEKETNGRVKDLRTIGVMSPARPVTVPKEDAENFSGQYFSVVAATVTESPVPGSDEIEKAFDECWVGDNGYLKPDGTRQKRAIAFQGVVRTEKNIPVTEVFIADIPEDVTVPSGEPLEGTTATRPAVPKGLIQRRITFTEDRKYPGIQGPRFWLRTSPDGSVVYFLMKDDNEVVQIYSVSVHGGDIRQVTSLGSSVQGQFNVSPDGKSIAVIADNSIWICDIEKGTSQRLTTPTEGIISPVVWNNAGDRVVYNQYVQEGSSSWLQIFTAKVLTPHP
jgi:hypothetical protein